MGKRYKQQQNMNTPGPASYENVKTSKKGPKFPFGTANRTSNNIGDSPGPGSYKVPVKVANLPRYALPSQNEEFKFV